MREAPRPDGVDKARRSRMERLDCDKEDERCVRSGKRRGGELSGRGGRGICGREWLLGSSVVEEEGRRYHGRLLFGSGRRLLFLSERMSLLGSGRRSLLITEDKSEDCKGDDGIKPSAISFESASEEDNVKLEDSFSFS